MAKLLPKFKIIQSQKIKPTEGEMAILKFLVENLDDNYEIFYQPFLNGDCPDIAILKKGSGTILLEVKDWNLDRYIVDNSGNWSLKINKARIKSPFDQVNSYKRNLINLHIEESLFLSENEENIVNCIVYFHNATYSQLLNKYPRNSWKNRREYIKNIIVWGYDSLNFSSLDFLKNKFRMNRNSAYFDETLYSSFRRYLKPPIHQIEDGIEITYTSKQKELIRSEIRPRRKIKGVAGSGKTLVLAKRAVNAHKRTKSRVLILTFNKSLKNYIHDRISDVREEFDWRNFYINHYHDFIKMESNNYNIEGPKQGDWENTSLFENVKDEIVKYDVILIDEIQDYKQEWVDIIAKYFMHENTEFVVFGDEKQNIYERPLDENKEPIVRTIPGSWNKSLNSVYRFSDKISDLIIKFQKEILIGRYQLDIIEPNEQLQLPLWDENIIEYHSFSDFNARHIAIFIFDFIKKNEIHSSDVGILASKIQPLQDLDYVIRNNTPEKTITTFPTKEDIKKYRPPTIKKLHDHKKHHFWMKTGTMKLSTIHSFKGWEIPSLFLIIDSDKDKPEIIYTALTRARQNLIILNIGNGEYHDFFTKNIEVK